MTRIEFAIENAVPCTQGGFWVQFDTTPLWVVELTKAAVGAAFKKYMAMGRAQWRMMNG
jgi:hypothetical protein